MKSGIISCLLLFSVMFSACNSASTRPSGSSDEDPVITDSSRAGRTPETEATPGHPSGGLYNVKWVLGEMNGKEVMVGEGQGQQPYITFSQNDQRAQGNGGCNSFSASITTGPDGKLTMKDAISTRMACGSMALEEEYFNMLEKVETCWIDVDVLSFFDAENKPIARFKTGN